jgi:hypothetical protein
VLGVPIRSAAQNPRRGFPERLAHDVSFLALGFELRELPAGTYVLEPVERTPLTEEEEEGLRVAMTSLHAGSGRTIDQVRQRIDAIHRR